MLIPTKDELRQLMLGRIKAQKEAVALFKSQVICEKVVDLPVFRSARTILCYASFGGEVDSFALMQKALDQKKRVALPLVRKEDKRIIAMLINSLNGLKPGAYGIPTPADIAGNAVAPEELDLVVVPGVAYDRLNNRLGRGAGYYDRFLSALPAATPTIGLAYDIQMVDVLPRIEAHDRPVSLVITN